MQKRIYNFLIPVLSESQFSRCLTPMLYPKPSRAGFITKG
uniref:Uncharacterized protein n=1 Tax=Tetranychus urticae TaxID=32264 RepID=T1JWI7_TETUR